MYKLHDEAVNTAVELKNQVANATHCEVIIAPVFTALKTVADRTEGSNVHVAAQNCSTHTEHSANTGEICADMIKDVGASYIIIGHSERRQFYGETDESVNQKTKACLHFGLAAIVCVGESPRRKGIGKRRNGRKNTINWCVEGFDSFRYGTYYYRLRACLGNWHRKNCHASAGSRNARIYSHCFG